MHTIKIVSLSSLSLCLLACGGLDVEEVRVEIDAPTGSVSNQQAVMAVDAKQSGSGPVLDLVIGGVPGRALTAEGKGHLSSLSIRTWESRARGAFDAVLAKDMGIARRSQALVAASCTNGPEAREAYEDLLGDLLLDSVFDKTPDGKASFSVDLAGCSSGTLTGTLSIELKMKLERDRFQFIVKETFENACEASDATTCVSGEALLSASADRMDDGRSLELLFAWKLAGSWNTKGVQRSAGVEGGMRLGAERSGAERLTDFEVLFFVNTPAGERYSYVWRLALMTSGKDGTLSWSIRGRDGELSCSVDETTVSCEGAESFSYSSTDIAGLDPAWFD